MSTVTDNDLKRLEDLIIKQFSALDTRMAGLENRMTGLENRMTGLENRMTKLEEGQTEIKGRLGIVEARLEDWKPAINKIPDLAEKVGELKNWRQIVIIAVTATVSGAIGWLLREGNLRP